MTLEELEQLVMRIASEPNVAAHLRKLDLAERRTAKAAEADDQRRRWEAHYERRMAAGWVPTPDGAYILCADGVLLQRPERGAYAVLEPNNETERLHRVRAYREAKLKDAIAVFVEAKKAAQADPVHADVRGLAKLADEARAAKASLDEAMQPTADELAATNRRLAQQVQAQRETQRYHEAKQQVESINPEGGQT
jgi:hypothetical protein